MRICPKCSAKNPVNSNFCKNCGASLEDALIIQDDFSAKAGDVLNKVSGIINDGARKAKEAAVVGIKKTKGAVDTEKEKMRNKIQSREKPAGYIPSFDLTHTTKKPGSNWNEAVQSSDQQGMNWENATDPNDSLSVTVEHYPFFQDEQEKAIAVIGESAAAADLAGEYKRPYAILTETRLYCKNESGNYIVKTSEIQSARETSHKVKNWTFILASIFPIICTVGFCFDYVLHLTSLGCILGVTTGLSIFHHIKKNFIKAAIAICIASFICSCCFILIDNTDPIGERIRLFLFMEVPSLIYAMNVRNAIICPQVYSIFCSGGTFAFLINDYPLQEFVDFQNKVAPFCKGRKPRSFTPNAPVIAQNSSQQKPSGVKRWGIIFICVILALMVLIGYGIYRRSHCKANGCDNDVYMDGYCKYHYTLYVLDDQLQGAFDKADGYLNEFFG